MEHLKNWQRDGKLLEVKTKTSDRPLRGRLVQSAGSRFEVALELEEELQEELEKDADCVVVIPWHAVEFVRVHQPPNPRIRTL